MEVIMNWLIDAINCVINALESHTVAITTFATVAVAAATIALARITRRHVLLTQDILKDNQQMRVDTQKPQITLYPAVYDDFDSFRCVGLVLENIGVGPALDVEFIYEPSFKISSDRTLGSLGFLHGLNYLPPKYNRRHEICGTGDEQYKTLMKKQLPIEVRYKDLMHNEYRYPFCLNFNKSVRLKPNP